MAVIQSWLMAYGMTVCQNAQISSIVACEPLPKFYGNRFNSCTGWPRTQTYLASNLGDNHRLAIFAVPVLNKCDELLGIGVIEVDRHVGELYETMS